MSKSFCLGGLNMDCAIILTEDKQLNGNVQRVLDNFKDCELSEIGAVLSIKTKA